ncbi:M20/M25/M40 family metallo-hydrolase [Psychroserpens mesophilus]|uniref:M20/M25/M40 family metallo-hydrolase n=1 Tax=Psychroserpens mesophilus TaxID=325473 RepID=UPI00058F9E82|nr:M20/M25/M40 family metallo-hydrolase [Psychroserpens mesophilus]
MKYLLPLCLILLIFSCKKEPKHESITITNTEVQDMVGFLASDELQGRMTGSDGIEVAAAYLENQLKSYGVKPYFETYRNHFKIADSIQAFNIVGFIEGTDDKLKDEVIILGAHYDHIGLGKTVENDSIGNGANDNATGTVGVLAMAKYFATKKNNKRSLMIILFTAEEMGLLGSKHLAKQLKTENLDLYTMVNFEMIGVPLKDRDYEAFVSGYDLSNMASKMNAYVGNNLIGFSDVSKKYSLFKRSDNYPFYQEFKLPCQTISSCDLTNFDYYHHVDDEISELNFDFMADLINKIIPAIEQMSNTPTKEIVMYESE